MNILHTYIDNMYIDPNDYNKHSFAQKWGLVSLARLGHNVTLLCGSRTNKKEEFTWNDIKVIQLPSKVQLTNSTRILKGFNKEIKKLKPDIIHTHHYGSFIPELSLLYSKRHKIPIVLTVHNSFTEGNITSKILAGVYLILMQAFLPFYNHTTFISKYLQNKKRFFLTKNKSSVVYNQIPKPLTPKISQSTEINLKYSQNILYIGRLSHQKGVDLLIKSISIVKEKIPNIKIQILGTGPDKYLSKLKKICKMKKVQDSVEFLGYKSGKVKEQIYSQSSVMVVPSRDEGFGNVVIEALLNKIPLIISNKGALSEAAGGFARIFKSGNKTDLANKIMDTLRIQGSEQQQTSIENAYKYASKFTSEKIATDLETIYNSLL